MKQIRVITYKSIVFLFVFVSFIKLQAQEDLSLKIGERLQLTNLPTLYIDTQEPVTSTEIYVNGNLYIATKDSLLKYNDSLRIRGRGNSFSAPKKSYKLKLNKKEHLMNLPAKAKDWPIVRHYEDKAMIRNSIAFEISRLCNLYFTPESRYVDVVLNDDFIGNYLLTDQVEVGGHRVDIEKQDIADIAAPNIEGGYLLEIDGYANTTHIKKGNTFPSAFYSKYSTPVTIKYPDEDDINVAQRNYIINYFNSFEDAIFNYKLGDALDSIYKYVNVDDFVNWYIATELTSNTDCIWSVYMMKDRGQSQITFGPLWDNDKAFANDSRIGDTRFEWIIDKAHNPTRFRKHVNILLSIPEIIEKIETRWKEIHDAGLEERLINNVDSLEVYLDASQKLNYQRWPILNQIVGVELEARESLFAEIDFVRSYIIDHIRWMDTAIYNIREDKKPFPIEENKWYTLTNFSSADKVLDLKGDIDSENTPTVLWDNKNGEKESQLFRFRKIDNRYYVVYNKLSNRVLDAKKKNGTSGQSPSDYILCTNNYRSNNSYQKWELAQVQSGVFTFINEGSQMVIDNYGGTNENGNEVNMWTAHYSENQQWKLTPISSYVSQEINTEYSHSAPIITVSKGRLQISRKDNTKLVIYDIYGQTVFTTQLLSTELNLQSGIYIIQTGSEKQKIVIP